jgi:hypothetical protein
MAVRLRLWKALAGACVAFAVSVANAQAPCRVLDPTLAGTYQGGCKDGLAEGAGEAKGTAFYRGEFRAGRKHGTGTYVSPAGDTYTGRWANDEPLDAPTPQMLARSRMEKERQIAVAKLGAKVCRKVTVGISESEWIRGVVVEVAEAKIGVRIEDPGELAATLDGAPVARGRIVRESVAQWVPCL